MDCKIFEKYKMCFLKFSTITKAYVWFCGAEVETAIWNVEAYWGF